MRKVSVPSRLREFVKLRPQVEGVVQPVGLRTWDLLLIDAAGNWVRDEFPSRDAALEVGARLGIRTHDGWGDDRIGRRMTRRDHWSTPDGQRRAL
jgi:hypothetical protein